MVQLAVRAGRIDQIVTPSTSDVRTRRPRELGRGDRHEVLVAVWQKPPVRAEQGLNDILRSGCQLVSSRCEHASLILTSNLTFSGWGGVFGDQAVAVAMIDRVVHDAELRQMPDESQTCGALSTRPITGFTSCAANDGCAERAQASAKPADSNRATNHGSHFGQQERLAHPRPRRADGRTRRWTSTEP